MEDGQSLGRLYLTCQSHMNALKNLGVESGAYGTMITTRVLARILYRTATTVQSTRCSKPSWTGISLNPFKRWASHAGTVRSNQTRKQEEWERIGTKSLPNPEHQVQVYNQLINYAIGTHEVFLLWRNSLEWPMPNIPGHNNSERTSKEQVFQLHENQSQYPRLHIYETMFLL